MKTLTLLAALLSGCCCIRAPIICCVGGIDLIGGTNHLRNFTAAEKAAELEMVATE
jgi:hypothetical protein